MTDPPKASDDSAPISIYKTNDLSRLAIAKSILLAADIPFFVKGEKIQTLFGLGGLGSVNPVTGPAEMQVAARDADSARDVLSDLIADEAE